MTSTVSDPPTKAPLRHRWLPLLAVAFGAPVCAEFLQGYLPSTGDLPMLLASLLIFAPLYGGAALLIREVAVRRRLGWTGVLLLAAAFGVAMPGLVDLSLFVEERNDISYWAELRAGTSIAGLGIAVFPTVSWVAGHIVMSIGAPLAILDRLAPRHRGRPLLGPLGIGLTAVSCALAALLIRNDTIRLYGAPAPARTIVVLAVVSTLVILALTRLGRPVAPGAGRPAPTWRLVLVGAVGIFTFDMLPATWFGVTAMAVLLLVAAVLLRRCSRASAWSPRQIGALAAGALVGRTLIGFLAPPAEGVTLAAKLSHNVLLLVAVLGLAWLVARPGAAPEPTASHGRQVD